MLHLAKVVKQGPSGNAGLELLATQKPDHTWELCSQEEQVEFAAHASLPAPESSEKITLGEGILVLAEIIDDRIEALEEATTWILNIIRDYLQVSVTPSFLAQEKEQAEQWRQALTLESQELARRSLEVEARLEKIQALEESLNKEKQRLEDLAAQLQVPSD